MQDTTIQIHVTGPVTEEIARSLVDALDAMTGVTKVAPVRAPVDGTQYGARFVATQDTVHDRETGLTWTRAKHIAAERLTHAEAEEAVAALTFGGHKWRLPTIKELLTLVDYERHDPAIGPPFECESSWYWTSTPAANSPADFAWSVYFDDGLAYWVHRGYGGFVRAVRASQ